VTGDFTVRDDLDFIADGDVDLPNLQVVRGDILVENTNAILTSLTMNNLVDVGGSIDVLGAAMGPWSLASLTMNNLTDVGGNIKVLTNYKLASLAMPNLVNVGYLQGEVFILVQPTPATCDLGRYNC